MRKQILTLILLILVANTTTYAQRETLKVWDFHYKNSAQSKPILIPHTWNNIDAFDDERGYWRGSCTYTREVNINTLDAVHYLHFDGANQVTKLWVNDQYVGEHIGGYSAFDFNISPYLHIGTNQLKVEVNNAHNEQIAPLDADFTFYGGIYRPVYLDSENPIHFKKSYGADQIKIDAIPSLNNEEGQLKISGAINNPSHQSSSLHVRILDPEGKLVAKQKLKADSTFNCSFQLDEVQKWSPNTPQLYQVELTLQDGRQILDTYQHAVGFRIVEATANGFLINGEPLKLIGVNRHQDWPGYGNAVPIELQVAELKSIKDMGANVLRLAHYPQSKAVYAAADSLGIILWSETPIINKVPIKEDYAPYARTSKQMLHEQIAQNYNHPSLVFVGYMNEIYIRLVFDRPEQPEEIKKKTVELATALEAIVRQEAPHHITVTAFHQNMLYDETGLGDIPMVVGWNLYFGWYGGEIYDLGKFLDDEHKKYPSRPLIISEYGVGADDRIHTDQPTKYDFSEEYQLLYHQGYLDQVQQRDFVIGMTAWNFADFGSEFRGDTKPHINQKGLVNYDRSKKNIYYWYAATLQPDLPLTRFYQQQTNYVSDDNSYNIRLISNQAVSLWQNDQLIARNMEPKQGIIERSLSLQQGENTFTAISANADTAYYHVQWQPANFSQKDSLCINFACPSYYTDAEGNTWSPESKLSSVLHIAGQSKAVKTATNIRQSEDEPLLQSALTQIDAIEVELPKGKYKLQLYLANLRKGNSSVYELGRTQSEVNTAQDGLQLSINGQWYPVGDIPAFGYKCIEAELVSNGKLAIGSNQAQFALNGMRIIRIP